MYLNENLEQCTFSLAPEAGSSPICYSDIYPSALSKLIPTAEMSCSPDSKMASCHDFQSGMTCERSMANPGEDALTLLLADSHAKIFQQPEKAEALLRRDQAFGLKCPESFAKYNPSLFSWKIPHSLLTEEWNTFLGTWPRWGTMQDGECWELAMLEPPTGENESGYWQTPVADDSIERAVGKLNSRGEPKLSAQVKIFPTPVSVSPTGGRCGLDGGSHARATLTEEERKDLCGGSLNPTWVEWLMGWPLEWTDLKPLAMDKFQQWLRAHGVCLANCRSSE